MLSSFQLYQTIFENTRITSSSKSCIDNCCTNIPECDRNSYVLNNDISDHNAQKVIFNIKKKNIKNFEPVYQSFFTVENKQTFIDTLKDQDWSDVFSAEKWDVNK